MQLSSYLEGNPPMWMMPLQLQVNQKSDYDMLKYKPKTALTLIKCIILKHFILVFTLLKHYLRISCFAQILNQCMRETKA